MLVTGLFSGLVHLIKEFELFQQKLIALKSNTQTHVSFLFFLRLEKYIFIFVTIGEIINMQMYFFKIINLFLALQLC